MRKINRIFTVVLIFIFTFLPLGGMIVKAEETIPIDVNGEYVTGIIETRTKDEMAANDNMVASYEFQVDKSTFVELHFIIHGCDAGVTLLDADEKHIDDKNVYDSNKQEPFTKTYSLRPGVYKLTIKTSAQIGDYKFKLTDKGSKETAPESSDATTPAPINVGESLTGMFYSGQKEFLNYYSFKLDKPDVITVSLSPTNEGSVSYSLENSDEVSKQDGTAYSKGIQGDPISLPSGNYLFKVSGNSEGAYNFKLDSQNLIDEKKAEQAAEAQKKEQEKKAEEEAKQVEENARNRKIGIIVMSSLAIVLAVVFVTVRIKKDKDAAWKAIIDLIVGLAIALIAGFVIFLVTR